MWTSKREERLLADLAEHKAVLSELTAATEELRRCYILGPHDKWTADMDKAIEKAGKATNRARVELRRTDVSVYD